MPDTSCADKISSVEPVEGISQLEIPDHSQGIRSLDALDFGIGALNSIANWFVDWMPWNGKQTR